VTCGRHRHSPYYSLPVCPSDCLPDCLEPPNLALYVLQGRNIRRPLRHTDVHLSTHASYFTLHVLWFITLTNTRDAPLGPGLSGTRCGAATWLHLSGFTCIFVRAILNCVCGTASIRLRTRRVRLVLVPYPSCLMNTDTRKTRARYRRYYRGLCTEWGEPV
jgi:hypothetical protein